ncbi:BQ2448_7517 [Microbotryum intermedium]|uniref:BQ2448_7517 protein n=1 Tax=Microbotryum intermedium TaxID=269621 RepID=A0A238FN56_9BASI|nr:BQ2448_7517 [Microbotryum intermedium]
MSTTPLGLLKSTPVPCYVDGQPFLGSGSFAVKDPHDPSNTLYEASSITTADLGKVLESSARAFKAWKKTSILDRRAIFLRACEILKQRQQSYASLEVTETTSDLGWAMFGIIKAIEGIEECAGVATVALRGEYDTTTNGKRGFVNRSLDEVITRCPFGTVLSVAAWNAPVVLSARCTSNPARNACILKTSEMAPRTQLILAEVFHEAGLPAGVLNVIHVAPEDAPKVMNAIIAHHSVGKVNFTGSSRVGSIVAQVAGKHLVPLTLELGGKAAAIVREDADLRIACNAIAFGGWVHSGQICMATQTVIAHTSIASQLISLLKAQATKVVASVNGAPIRGLFTQELVLRTKTIVEEALAKGAEIVAGCFDVKDNLFQPLVLKGVTPDMQIYHVEMFAPVVSIITYETEEDAIRIANDHEYGLSAAIFTKDIDRALKLAEEIDSGAVHINGSTLADEGHHPHGGWKKSGYGRFNGIEGIREFTQLKVVTINEPHGQYPI